MTPRPTLAEIIVMPLRMHLDQSTVDRTADLGVRMERLLKDFTPREIRQHLDKVDAANEEVY